jgi:hypothetical protein
MDSRILIVALLAFSLVLFGCAKGGSTPSGVAGGVQGAGEQGAAPSSVPLSGQVEPAEEGAGTSEPETGGEPQAPPETQTGAEGNGSEPDLGGLFNIDTVQPESGSGYDIPAAGEE